jgi:hypothetical protein
MTRALGFHSLGDELAYALIEKLESAPAQVLAAGRVHEDELEALVDRLDGRKLLWALASAEGGRTRRVLPQNWPLRARGEEVLTGPAAAAAFWDWEHGRFDIEDLYLWVSVSSLHWSRGLPGRDLAGSVPRKGPIRDSLRPALARAQANRNPVVMFVEGDAPGAEILEETIRKAGHRVRPLTRPAEEMGVDPAAAGAALARLTEGYHALRAPAQVDSSLAWRRMIGAWILVTLLLGWAASAAQEVSFRNWIDAQGAANSAPNAGVESADAAAAPPRAWTDLMQRRQAVLVALEGASSETRLSSLRIVSDVLSPEIRMEQEPVKR